MAHCKKRKRPWASTFQLHKARKERMGKKMLRETVERGKEREKQEWVSVERLGSQHRHRNADAGL